MRAGSGTGRNSKSFCTRVCSSNVFVTVVVINNYLPQSRTELAKTKNKKNPFPTLKESKEDESKGSPLPMNLSMYRDLQKMSFWRHFSLFLHQVSLKIVGSVLIFLDIFIWNLELPVVRIEQGTQLNYSDPCVISRYIS